MQVFGNFPHPIKAANRNVTSRHLLFRMCSSIMYEPAGAASFNTLICVLQHSNLKPSMVYI